ncbi:MAG: type II secretion system protein GspN [Desulfobacterales bacterium]|jgi:type II secretion system protein N
MKISKKSIFYTIYIIAITGIFLYFLFPSDTLKTYLAYRLSQGNPDVTVTIDRVSPVIPPGISLYNVAIAHQNKPLVDLEKLKLMPGILSLFSDKTTVNFKGYLNEGTISGRAELDDHSGAQEVTCDGRISGLQVEGIPALQRLPADKIAGVLNGNFTLANVGSDRSLTGKLTLSKSKIELKKAVFNVKSLEFRDIDADLIVKNDTLTINQTKARGNQLDADLSGKIALAGQSGKQAMNLSVSVTPHHLLLAKIEKNIPMDFLRNKKAGEAAISFKIDGTLDNPNFSLN